MADKEVTQFVVDVGSHMANTSNGRSKTDLETGLQYVKDVIANKVLKERKTDVVSLSVVNTPETNNSQGVQNLSVLHGIKQPLSGDLGLYRELKPTDEKLPDSDGIIRAVLVALSDLKDYVGTRKYKKNIVLVTNSSEIPELNEDMARGVASMCVSLDVKLVVIGADFDDSSLGDEQKQVIESWKNFIVSVPGSVLLDGSQVDELINYPAPKAVRPVKLFEVQFRIGANLLDESIHQDSSDEVVEPKKGKSKKLTDYEELFQLDESCVSFTVEGYPAIKAALPPSKSLYGINPATEKPTPMKASTDYEIHNYNEDSTNLNELEFADEEELSKQLYESELVDKTSLVKGYKYGKSTVVLNDLLEAQRIYKTLPGLDIRGVVESKLLPRAYLTSEAILVLGSKTSVAHQKNLAAFVDALTEMDSFAIARFVPKPNAEVQMVVLIPVYVDKAKGITLTNKRKADDEDLEDIRAFILTRLPFNEDEKIANFPDLTTVKTTSGRVLTDNNRLLPTEEIEQVMDDLVKNFDLNKLGDETDFQGHKRIFNPLISSGLLPLPGSRGNHDNLVRLSPGIHRVNQFLKNALIDSTDALPELNEHLKKDTYPDPELLKSVDSELNKLKELLDLGPIVDKTAKPRKKRSTMDEIVEEEEDIEELTLEDLLSRGAK